MKTRITLNSGAKTRTTTETMTIIMKTTITNMKNTDIAPTRHTARISGTPEPNRRPHPTSARFEEEDRSRPRNDPRTFFTIRIRTFQLSFLDCFLLP